MQPLEFSTCQSMQSLQDRLCCSRPLILFSHSRPPEDATIGRLRCRKNHSPSRRVIDARTEMNQNSDTSVRHMAQAFACLPHTTRGQLILRSAYKTRATSCRNCCQLSHIRRLLQMHVRVWFSPLAYNAAYGYNRSSHVAPDDFIHQSIISMYRIPKVVRLLKIPFPCESSPYTWTIMP